ncbi:unnamed protein product [Rotaria sp. Silwood2]|nr:unnamed protein product [Rotaria sp. Silwood2]CAF4570407.1 unnamed protein product [Rotaria sp. Silwood2]
MSITNEFNIEKSFSDSSHSSTELPCYIHIKCDRSEKIFCLDCREVCNGHIDEGLDEAYCFDMELNECEENKYRCHNDLITQLIKEIHGILCETFL